MKRVKSIIVTVCMMLAFLLPISVQAETVTYSGTNVNSQNYSRYASTVDSYLTECEDGTLMRVQYVSSKSCVIVEYYDADYNLLSTKEIPQELSIFGGFYAMNGHYFLLTGQMNEEESDEVEVYRITKYDKKWNRIASAGLYGANTYIPFDAGSARMDASGKYLLIRTCHEMYMSSDGYHHQANVTIQVDTDAMQITDSYAIVMNVAYGYVSHSFNQFIKVENGKIVAVDHGDAYPRSIVLCKYPTDVTSGTFRSNRVAHIDVMSFPGMSGDNTTGATVGGFELSDTSYLIAGNSVVQDENNTSRHTRNVFLAAVDKATNQVTTNWITAYEEGETSTATPQLVKISNDEFMILWSRGSNVYYMTCDGKGQNTSPIYNMANAAISDCVPVVKDGKVIWYTWSNETVSFYEISLNNIVYPKGFILKNGVIQTKTFCGDEKHNIVKVEYKESGCYEDGHHAHWGCSVCGSAFKDAQGKEPYDLVEIIIPAVHKYEVTDIVEGTAHLVCSACGDEADKIAPTDMTIYWNYNGGLGFYSTYFEDAVQIGDKVYYWIQPSPTNYEGAVTIVTSDPDIIKYTPTSETEGYFTMLKSGTVTVTISSEYNPKLGDTFTFYIGCKDNQHNIVKVEAKEATCTEDGHQEYWICTDCEATYKDAQGNEPIDVEDIKITAQHKYEAEETIEGTVRFVCSVCGDVQDKNAPTSMIVYWNYTNGNGYYYSNFKSKVNVGDIVYYWAEPLPEDYEGAINVLISDPEKISFHKTNSEMGYFTMLKPGKVEVMIVPEYNPDLSMTYTFDIAQETMFEDVNVGDWFYNAVMWGAENKVVAGLTETKFGPAEVCTRAQIVAFLWRAAGRPEPQNTECPFTDVAESEFYYKAMLWAVENNIAKGYTEDKFAPNVTCTRAEMATFLWRVDGRKEVTGESPFIDVTTKDYFYKPAIWASQNKVVSGYEGGIFAPHNTIARAETVTMLYRYYK